MVNLMTVCTVAFAIDVVAGTVNLAPFRPLREMLHVEARPVGRAAGRSAHPAACSLEHELRFFCPRSYPHPRLVISSVFRDVPEYHPFLLNPAILPISKYDTLARLFSAKSKNLNLPCYIWPRSEPLYLVITTIPLFLR